MPFNRKIKENLSFFQLHIYNRRKHNDFCPEQQEFGEHLKNIILLRKNEENFSSNQIFFYDVQDSRVFAFKRNLVHVIANFSESPASFRMEAWSETSTDILCSKTFSNKGTINLAPYEVLWLKENIRN